MSPEIEAARLDYLRSLEIVGTPSEPQFDAVARLARDLFGVPIALISLIESDEQWFKARCGLGVEGTSRSVSFCSHAITGDDVLVVEDAWQDPRFWSNALVTGDPHIRFYAGAPIIVPFCAS